MPVAWRASEPWVLTRWTQLDHEQERAPLDYPQQGACSHAFIVLLQSTTGCRMHIHSTQAFLFIQHAKQRGKKEKYWIFWNVFDGQRENIHLKSGFIRESATHTAKVTQGQSWSATFRVLVASVPGVVALTARRRRCASINDNPTLSRAEVIYQALSPISFLSFQTQPRSLNGT